MADEFLGISKASWAKGIKNFGLGLQGAGIVENGFIQQGRAYLQKANYLSQAYLTEADSYSRILTEQMKRELLKLQLSQQITRYGQARADLLNAYERAKARKLNNAVARGVAVNSGSALAVLAGLDASRAQDIGQQRVNFENELLANKISNINSIANEKSIKAVGEARKKAYLSAANAIDTDYPWAQTLIGLAGLFAGSIK